MDDRTQDRTPGPADRPGADPAADPAQAPVTDPALDPADDPGADPADNPGADPADDPGAEQAGDPAVDPAVDPATDEAAEQAAEQAGGPPARPAVRRTARGAKGLLGALMGLVMLGTLAIGGIVGVRMLTADDGTAPVARTAPTSSPATRAATNRPPAAGSPNGTAGPSPAGSPTESPDDGSTLDDTLQAAAERAAGSNPNASLVALDMNSGEIRATVHRQAGMSGAVPPGSTFKVLTSALLLYKGVVTPSGPAPCPATTTVNGQTIRNVNGMEIPDATFRDAFSRSCNTTFVALRESIGDDELSDFATRWFGLNSDAWTVGPGQGTVDGIVPPAADPNDKAAQMIGQGTLGMNPLTMASVVATAVTGEFHQPVLNRDMPVHTVSETLPAGVTRAIRALMIDCATNGTAKEVFAGLPGVGAKTGTAEVGDGTDGWMVAFRGDIAVAVYVQGGTSGSASAGPIAREFLEAVPVP